MESHHLRRVLEANHELKLDLLAGQLQSEQCQFLEIQHDLLGIEQDQIAQMQMSEVLDELQQAKSTLRSQDSSILGPLFSPPGATPMTLNEQIQQQAQQAAEAAFAIYQQAYRDRFQALLADERPFELEKQLIAQRYHNQGLELGMLAVEAKQQAFQATVQAMESGNFNDPRLKLRQRPAADPAQP